MTLAMSTAYCLFLIQPSTTEMYTLSLHDALPILGDVERVALVGGQLEALPAPEGRRGRAQIDDDVEDGAARAAHQLRRSEEHTSELQSHSELVCRLLLEKKKLCSDLTRPAPTP